MLKLPNSIEPAVMAENIAHLRDAIDSIDVDVLPEVSEADNGDVLTVVSGAWAKAAPSGSGGYDITEVETDTGLKLNGDAIYCKRVRYSDYDVTLSTSVNFTVDLPASDIKNIVAGFAYDTGKFGPVAAVEIGETGMKIGGFGMTISKTTGYFVFYYTKNASEATKTTKKKTTK